MTCWQTVARSMQPAKSSALVRALLVCLVGWLVVHRRAAEGGLFWITDQVSYNGYDGQGEIPAYPNNLKISNKLSDRRTHTHTHTNDLLDTYEWYIYVSYIFMKNVCI